MFSAADLLEALRRRRTLKSIRPEEPGRLPPGWERWLAQMPEREGAVTGAAPAAYIDLFLERPLRPPPRRGAMLTRWQAFATVWRQQWHASEPDERGLRVFAMASSLVVHACLGVMLAWLMYLHLLVLPPPSAGEVQVTQVEYIGVGTPEEAGGGEVPPATETAVEPAQQASAAPAAGPATPSPVPAPDEPAPEAVAPPVLRDLPVDVATPVVAATTPPLPQREIPTPSLPPTSQPLQVTEVERPDIDFVLPPPTTRVDPVRQPELAVPTREIPAPEVVEALEPELPSRLPAIAVEIPDAVLPVPALPQRQVPAPEAAEVADLPDRVAPAPVVSAPRAPVRIPEVAVATIPAPAGAPADATGQAREPTPAGAGETAVAPASGQSPAGEQQAGEQQAAGRQQAGEQAAGTQAPSTVAGAGPETAVPGGWPSPTRGDDWDDALRDRAGGQAGEGGLFDESGRPRLAGTGEGGPPGGAPPGSAAREAIDLEKGGTWLRRPPLDYRPTRFDRFWIPSGTLLEEWVRRGIRQMSIPIPGTSKEIVCVVSILQLGGGCMLNDPDLNDQPSTGRAAPDVPFRPELQEDQESLARPPGG